MRHANNFINGGFSKLSTFRDKCSGGGQGAVSGSEPVKVSEPDTGKGVAHLNLGYKKPDKRTLGRAIAEQIKWRRNVKQESKRTNDEL